VPAHWLIVDGAGLLRWLPNGDGSYITRILVCGEDSGTKSGKRIDEKAGDYSTRRLICHSYAVS